MQSFLFIRLEQYMQEIQNKKKLLQTEINRIQSEMNSMKMQIPTEPLGCLDPKVLQQKVSNWYIIGIEYINYILS